MNKPIEHELSASLSASRSTGRRDFLKTNVVVGGALLVGINSVTGCASKPGTAMAPVYSDAWVKVAPDNSITIVCARSEMGQAVATSMPLLIAEELEVPIERVKVEFAPLGAVYGNDALGGAAITGGSTSVRDGWVKLRRAGAATREVLVAAAAKTWDVPISSCTAKNGVVSHSSGKSLTYGQLAVTAQGMPLAKEPKLKSPDQFTQIGKASLRRTDTADKVNARTVYGIDVKMPNMAIASLAQSPVIGGKVKSFDASAARAMAGVYGIYQITDGVAVVARDFHLARKARDTIKINWDFGPAGNLNSAGMAASLKQASQKPGVSIRKDGNYQAVAAAAAKKVGGEYSLPMLAHSAMEPINCTAEVANGKCTVIGPIQFQTGAAGVAAAIAKSAGVEEKNVAIQTVFLGGGFGRKLELDFVQQVVEIARQAGRPVKLIWTREDDMQHDFYRPMSLHHVEGAIDANGKLTGLKAKMISASITARAFPPFFQNGVDPFMNEGSHNLTYKIPAIQVDTVVQDLGIRVGYWRSVSHPLNAFAIESLMDELAAAAGKNPLEFRLAALEGDARAQKALRLVAERSGWANKRNAIGLAQMECYQTYVALAIEVNPANPLQIRKITCVADCGLSVHPDQVVAQLESGIIFGLTAVLHGEITIKNGVVEQSNFHDQAALRMNEVPPIEIIVANTPGVPIGGMGEVGVPLVAPAFANAIAAATGKRLRSLPFTKV